MIAAGSNLANLAEAERRVEEFLDRWEKMHPGNEIIYGINGLELTLTVPDLRALVWCAAQR